MLRVLGIGLSLTMTTTLAFSAPAPPTSDERPSVVGGLAFVDEVKPVSYTHLTLPTTPYV